MVAGLVHCRAAARPARGLGRTQDSVACLFWKLCKLPASLLGEHVGRFQISVREMPYFMPRQVPALLQGLHFWVHSRGTQLRVCIDAEATRPVRRVKWGGPAILRCVCPEPRHRVRPLARQSLASGPEAARAPSIDAQNYCFLFPNKGVPVKCAVSSREY